MVSDLGFRLAFGLRRPRMTAGYRLP